MCFDKLYKNVKFQKNTTFIKKLSFTVVRSLHCTLSGIIPIQGSL